MSNNSSDDGPPTPTLGAEVELDDLIARAIETLVEETRERGAEFERFDPDLLFETLAEPAHRYVLTYLLRSEGAVSVGELVDYVTAQTEHTMNANVYRERVVSKLTNTYLPELDEAGFVQYNMERQLVGPTDLTPFARPYLLLALAHIQANGDDKE